MRLDSEEAKRFLSYILYIVKEIHLNTNGDGIFSTIAILFIQCHVHLKINLNP